MTDKKSEDQSAKFGKPLTDDQIVTERKVGWRSLLTMVGAGLVGAAAMAARVRPAGAQGVSDNDTGNYADPPGRGRRGGGGGGGVTDGDTGNYADPSGRGRGRPNGGGVTDGDTGNYADTPGNGRRGY